MDWLVKNEVREMHIKSMTVWEKLFGNERKNTLPYTIEEISNNTDRLGRLFDLKKGIYFSLIIKGKIEKEYSKYGITEENYIREGKDTRITKIISTENGKLKQELIKKAQYLC